MWTFPYAREEDLLRYVGLWIGSSLPRKGNTDSKSCQRTHSKALRNSWQEPFLKYSGAIAMGFEPNQ